MLGVGDPLTVRLCHAYFKDQTAHEIWAIYQNATSIRIWYLDHEPFQGSCSPNFLNPEEGVRIHFLRFGSDETSTRSKGLTRGRVGRRPTLGSTSPDKTRLKIQKSHNIKYHYRLHTHMPRGPKMTTPSKVQVHRSRALCCDGQLGSSSASTQTRCASAVR